ncbi:MAG: hypothetical protein C4326_00415 [Ignavibacteria bacterium]
MALAEVLRSTLLSLIEVTNELCKTVADGDYSPLSELLDRREQLLEQQAFLLARWKDFSQNVDNERRELARLRPLSDLLHKNDEHLTGLIAQKRDQIAEQLRRAENQRRLLVYSR